MKRSKSRNDNSDENIGSDVEIGQKITQNLDNKNPEKPKRRYPGFRRNLYDYFTEYSSNTGIHGFKYMGEQHRSLAEKICWLLVLCVSLYICINLIIQTYIKWDTTPVLVSFAKSPTPVWRIPFPAITICSETKTRQRVYNYTKAYHESLTNQSAWTEEDYKKFTDVSLVCDSHLYTEGNKTTDFESIKFLMEVAPHFGETFFSCRWTSVNESCHNFFSPILTEDGICFTFNMLDKTELFTNAVYFNEADMASSRKSEGWTLEDGYPTTAGKDTIPRRAISAGASAGLFLLLSAYEQDLDYICKGPVQGFKVLLHNPAEIPRVGTQYFRAPLNQEVVVSVKPDMMTTSDGLKDYDPHRRQCYFPKERRLQFFQSYTQQNCQVECLANFTLKRCGCVAYHMPHEEATKICGTGNQICMWEARNELLAQEVESGLSSFPENNDEEITDCDCLPACTSISYNAETSQADFNWERVFQAFKANMSEFPGIQFTRISIFFKEMQFITSERNELYGQTDFLANCGGLLGLFTGFSFLSIIEIIYFLSLRLLCNFKKYGRHYWSASENLINDDAYLHN